MLFNSFQYWIFFLLVAVLFYSIPFRAGKVLLLCASYVFYMWWDPRFIVLIVTSTVVDYYLGILLEVAGALPAVLKKRIIVDAMAGRIARSIITITFFTTRRCPTSRFTDWR